jgi:hypothetical protein
VARFLAATPRTNSPEFSPLDFGAVFTDNLRRVVRRPHHDIPRKCDRIRFSGRASFLSIFVLGILSVALLGLAGCLGVAISTNPVESRSNSPAVPAPPEATPQSVSFGTVNAGVSYNQTVLLSNVGPVSVTVTQVAATGNGFAVSPFSLPLTLTAGQSASLAIDFDSSTPGNASGALAVTSNAAGSPTSIGLSATVAPAVVQLSPGAASVNFGNTTVGVTSTQNVTLTNTGNSAVSISSVSTGNSAFTVGGAPDVTLAPNQSVSVAVNFDPAAAGLATGNLVVTSNAPPVQTALSGTGISGAGPQYSVTLNWSPSASIVVGYYVYRGVGTNPQLSKFSEVVASTSYQDPTVQAGQSYTYAITSVDASGDESALSTSVSVTIPSQ